MLVADLPVLTDSATLIGIVRQPAAIDITDLDDIIKIIVMGLPRRRVVAIPDAPDIGHQASVRLVWVEIGVGACAVAVLALAPPKLIDANDVTGMVVM